MSIKLSEQSIFTNLPPSRAIHYYCIAKPVCNEQIQLCIAYVSMYLLILEKGLYQSLYDMLYLYIILYILIHLMSCHHFIKSRPTERL